MPENPQYQNDAQNNLNDYRFNRDLQRYRAMRQKIVDVFRRADNSAKTWCAGWACAAVIHPIFFVPKETDYAPIAIMAISFAASFPILYDFLRSNSELTELRTELSELEKRLNKR